MKFVIFAGGTGRRLWPISRQSSPKQFESIVGSRSTVQLAVDRVADRYGVENVYVSTNKRYHELIARQLPELPSENLIAEPVRRDLAPAVGLAIAADERQWGLLNQVSLPQWTSVLVGVVAFDLIIYLQHVLFHAVPALWRVHRLHHADFDFDITTGVRFHPLEILLSMGLKLAVVAALGIPAADIH